MPRSRRGHSLPVRQDVFALWISGKAKADHREVEALLAQAVIYKSLDCQDSTIYFHANVKLHSMATVKLRYSTFSVLARFMTPARLYLLASVLVFLFGGRGVW